MRQTTFRVILASLKAALLAGVGRIRAGGGYGSDMSCRGHNAPCSLQTLPSTSVANSFVAYFAGAGTNIIEPIEQSQPQSPHILDAHSSGRVDEDEGSQMDEDKYSTLREDNSNSLLPFLIQSSNSNSEKRKREEDILPVIEPSQPAPSPLVDDQPQRPMDIFLSFFHTLFRKRGKTGFTMAVLFGSGMEWNDFEPTLAHGLVVLMMRRGASAITTNVSPCLLFTLPKETGMRFVALHGLITDAFHSLRTKKLEPYRLRSADDDWNFPGHFQFGNCQCPIPTRIGVHKGSLDFNDAEAAIMDRTTLLIIGHSLNPGTNGQSPRFLGAGKFIKRIFIVNPNGDEKVWRQKLNGFGLTQPFELHLISSTAENFSNQTFLNLSGSHKAEVQKYIDPEVIQQNRSRLNLPQWFVQMLPDHRMGTQLVSVKKVFVDTMPNTITP